MRYSISINLKKVPSAFVANIQGKTDKKPCLCIPLDSEGLFIGEKNINLDVTAFENTNFGNSHTLRLSVRSERYNAMTDEEKKAIPYLGSMREIVGEAAKTDVEASAEVEDNTDLPF